MWLLMFTMIAMAGFPEDFGDLVGPTGCSAAWTDYCESGWSALGGTSTSDMGRISGTSNVGVLTAGASGAWPNGVENIHVLPANANYIRFRINLITFDKSTVAQRLVFLNSSGGTISSRNLSRVIPSNTAHAESMVAIIPSGAVKVRVQFGVKGSGSPLVWLDSVDITYPSGDPQEGDDGGGVSVVITCDPSSCDAAAIADCPNADPCKNINCGSGEVATPICYGECLENDVCAYESFCDCKSAPTVGIDIGITP